MRTLHGALRDAIPDSRSARKHRSWAFAQYLAVAGGAVLLWETWTISAWLRDGPRQITEFRDASSANWYGARVFEVVGVICGVVLGSFVIRECIRRRSLTFDAMFCLVGFTLFWSDVGINFFQPTLLMSANWLNLNSPLGHMPFVVNPDAGRVPDPVFFALFFESFMWLLGCKIALVIDRHVRARWPNVTAIGRVLLLTGIGIHMQLLFEIPVVALGLWTYTSPAWMSLPLLGYRLPVTEIIAGGSFFACGAALYVLRDDRGRTIVERGLDHLKPSAQKAVSLLALYCALQFIIWIPASVPDMLFGPYQEPWPKWPKWLVNSVCNAPGFSNTRYGQCPGDPEYRMPGRHSLPGVSP